MTELPPIAVETDVKVTLVGGRTLFGTAVSRLPDGRLAIAIWGAGRTIVVRAEDVAALEPASVPAARVPVIAESQRVAGIGWRSPGHALAAKQQKQRAAEGSVRAKARARAMRRDAKPRGET